MAHNPVMNRIRSIFTRIWFIIYQYTVKYYPYTVNYDPNYYYCIRLIIQPYTPDESHIQHNKNAFFSNIKVFSLVALSEALHLPVDG